MRRPPAQSATLPGELTSPLPTFAHRSEPPTSSPDQWKRRGQVESVRDRRRLVAAFRMGDSILALGLLLGAFLVTNANRTPQGFDEFLSMRLTLKNLILLLLFALVWRAICTAAGLYRWQRPYEPRQEIARVLLAVMLGSCAALALPAASVTGAFSTTAILYFGLATAVALLLMRKVLRTVFLARGQVTRYVLIVGSGRLALEAYRELQESVGCPYHLVGFVDSPDGPVAQDVQQHTLGRLEDLESVLMRHAIDEVLIALPVKSRYTDIQNAIQACEQVGVHIRHPANVFGHARARHMVADERFTVHSTTVLPDDQQMLLKRVVDVVGASCLLVLLSPVFVIAGVAVWSSGSGPIFFAQRRFGYHKRQFNMYKIRTMVADAEALQDTLEAQNEASGPVFKIRADPRITRIGRILRRTSIDELPQLFNVLRGDMSLVGPRPLPLRDVQRFTDAALMRRFSVRPGITCLWQVSGRSNLSFDDWIRLDLKYIDEWSLGLDTKILARTLPAVLWGDGAT